MLSQQVAEPQPIEEGAAEYRKLKSLPRRLETVSRRVLAYQARRA